MYDVQSIIKRYNEGESLKFIFFWGPEDGRSGRGCLNQWASSPFVYNHKQFACAEQAMMAGKAALFGDWEVLSEIFDCENPRAVKALGRIVKGFDVDVWERNRIQIVTDVNYQKFSQIEEFKRYLLSTGDSILVEASPYDTIWGIGMRGDHPTIPNPNTWRGLNLLGQCLMAVRAQLSAAERDVNRGDIYE